MAQYDVYRTRTGDLVLDCQTDMLRDLNSRFVVPLETLGMAPPLSARLNPVFDCAGEQRVMKTHFAAAIPARDMVEWTCSLADKHYTIQAALDMLTSGF